MMMFRRDVLISVFVLTLYQYQCGCSAHSIFNATSHLRGIPLSIDETLTLSCGSHHSSDDEDSDRQNHIAIRSQTQPFPETTIPVCFHILTDDRDTNSLSLDQIQNQMDYLNRAFSSASCCNTTLEWCKEESCSAETGFRFAWAQLDDTKQKVIPEVTVQHFSDDNACLLTHNIPKWTRFFGFWDPRLRWMKRKLRKGDATTLNVYWTDFWTMNIAGYSTFPYSYWRKPQLDGVVLRVGVIAGGSITQYAQGAMLAHETGHWLGLYHTFEKGCDARSDKVDDTPQELEAFRGCGQIEGFPLYRDSCPDAEGIDPVHNFMDYGECSFEFTQGQVERMQASYERYRKGK